MQTRSVFLSRARQQAVSGFFNKLLCLNPPRIPACAWLLSVIGKNPPDRRVKKSHVGIAAEKEIHWRSNAFSVSKPYAAPALLSVCLHLKEPHGVYGCDVQEHQHIQTKLLDDDRLEA